MHMEKLLSKRDFVRLVRNPQIHSIENDERTYNLARGYWVYGDLLADLRAAGWQRFGPGFKGGVYGHPDHDYCIKILGMGVGRNPLFFVERGEYVDHERRMMQHFRAAGYVFAPEVLEPAATVRFLEMVGVRPFQAETRVARNDVLVTERIRGIPLAIQTGRDLTYDLCIDVFEADVIAEMEGAIAKLRLDLHRANVRGLFHNDPMPPNILFTLDDRDCITARLVDFEIAQAGTGSPEFVVNTVNELYRERAVPVNPQTSIYMTSLDMHLLDQTADVLRHIKRAVEKKESFFDALSLEIPFIGVSIEVGKAWRYLRGRL